MKTAFSRTFNHFKIQYDTIWCMSNPYIRKLCSLQSVVFHLSSSQLRISYDLQFNSAFYWPETSDFPTVTVPQECWKFMQQSSALLTGCGLFPAAVIGFQECGKVRNLLWAERSRWWWWLIAAPGSSGTGYYWERDTSWSVVFLDIS